MQHAGLLQAVAFFAVTLAAGLAAAQTPDNTSAPPPPAYQTTVHARPRRDDGTPQIVMTARELQERGVQNLADALALIPEVQVRQGGMGIRVDVRGAKQFSILLLVDGVPLTEPYFGIYDVSSIPVTDIVEIRVQLAPASPLEGPGGDGGIIEVLTLRGIGGRLLKARLVGGSTPEGEVALTGREPLKPTLGIRASVGARLADPSYAVIGTDGKSQASFSDLEWNTNASLRLEYETDRNHLTGDVFYGHRTFFIPPSDTATALLQHVTSEDAARLVIGSDMERSGTRIALGLYGELVQRNIDEFTDYTLANKVLRQDLLSGRSGAAALVDRRYRLAGLIGTLSARLSLDSEVVSLHQVSYGNGTIVDLVHSSTYGELAVGSKARWRQLSFEAAFGALLPFDNPSVTWPEGKLVVGYHPHRMIDVLIIGARKGRLPTLRELYDPQQGNDKLGPEQTWHGELSVRVRPHPLFAARFSGYLRRIDGLIRLDSTTSRDVNLGTINVRGLETGFDLARDRILGVGGTYIFEDAYSADPALLFDAIPNFPRHRIDVYLASTWRRRIGALVRFDWVSERLVQQTVLPRYYVMELDVWARIYKTLRGSVRLDNLTNATYQILPGLNALPITVTATVEGTWP